MVGATDDMGESTGQEIEVDPSDLDADVEHIQEVCRTEGEG